MNSYNKYWIFTGLLLAAVVFVVYQGLLGWVLLKFPEFTVRLVSLTILAILGWTYVVDGHRAALRLWLNERALKRVSSGNVSGTGTIVECIFHETKALHDEGADTGQRDFSTLFGLQQESLASKLSEIMVHLDWVRVFLFLLGIFFTLLGIVNGIGMQVAPTNPEESRVFATNIISALGFSYIAAAQCIGGFLILLILSKLMQSSANSISDRFDHILYRCAFFGKLPSERNRGKQSHGSTSQ